MLYIQGVAEQSRNATHPRAGGECDSSFSDESEAVVRNWNRIFTKQADLTPQLAEAIRETIREGNARGFDDYKSLFSALFTAVKDNPFLAAGEGASSAMMKGGVPLSWLLSVKKDTGTRRLWDYVAPAAPPTRQTITAAEADAIRRNRPPDEAERILAEMEIEAPPTPKLPGLWLKWRQFYNITVADCALSLPYVTVRDEDALIRWAHLSGELPETFRELIENFSHYRDRAHEWTREESDP